MTAPRVDRASIHRRHADGRFVAESEDEAKARFWSNVSRSGRGCWEWTGMKQSGYGRCFWRGKYMKAHRLMLLLMGRDVPAEMSVDHLCSNPGCVNPDHLDVVAIRVNILRGTCNPAAINARKIQCKRGHQLAITDKAGKRHCRECRIEHYRSYRQRKRASHDALAAALEGKP